MTDLPDPSRAVHPRLVGVVSGGVPHPNAQRVAKRAFWFLVATNGIERAGWGDLTGTDLEHIADVLDDDEIFLPVREHDGVRLGNTADVDIEPTDAAVDMLVENVVWLVADRSVHVVVDQRDGQHYGAAPPGGTTSARLMTRDELRGLLDSSVTISVELRRINRTFGADLTAVVRSRTHSTPLWEALRRVSLDAEACRRVLAVAAGEFQFSDLAADERVVAHAVIDARIATRAAEARFGDIGSE